MKWNKLTIAGIFGVELLLFNGFFISLQTDLLSKIAIASWLSCISLGAIYFLYHEILK